jgi:hypothetical protein
MGEIQGTVRNFQQLPSRETNKPWLLVWNFDIEWEVGNGSYHRRNVEMCSSNFMGMLWNGLHVKVVDTGTDPIIVDEVTILGKVDASVSKHLEKGKWRETPQESVEGEVLNFTARQEVIGDLGGGERPTWFPVWDLELGDGEPTVLVEFRSEKLWHGLISQGDRVKAYGTRSSGNVLLASRLEDESNDLKLKYEPAFARWW